MKSTGAVEIAASIVLTRINIVTGQSRHLTFDAVIRRVAVTVIRTNRVLTEPTSDRTVLFELCSPALVDVILTVLTDVASTVNACERINVVLTLSRATASHSKTMINHVVLTVLAGCTSWAVTTAVVASARIEYARPVVLTW